VREVRQSQKHRALDPEALESQARMTEWIKGFLCGILAEAVAVAVAFYFIGFCLKISKRTPNVTEEDEIDITKK